MSHRTDNSWFLKAYLALLIVAATPSLLPAQEPLWGGALVSKIDSLTAVILSQGRVAGLSIGVKIGDQILLAKGYGEADIENAVPATAETVYRIGSITKQFTAAAIMQLVEGGRIGLEDPITDHLVGYPTQGHNVTIRHLLTHTSGIKSYTRLENWLPKRKLDLTDEEFLALFKHEPFDFIPGEQIRYNNSAFYLLGVVVGEASGETYGEYVDAHLFGPLGLTRSSYCDERRIIPGRAEGYDVVSGRLMNDVYLSMDQSGAAGALCSTVLDLLSWSASLRGGRAVTAASYGQMTTSATLTDGSATGYGFGLGLGNLEGNPSVSHGGDINGFSAMLAHYPDSDLDVVVLSNTTGDHPGRIAEMIAKWTHGIEVSVVLDERTPVEQLGAYVGVYELRAGLELAVTVSGGQLFVAATGQAESRLRAQGKHVFVPTFDDAVRIVFTVSGDRASSLIFHQEGQVVEAPRLR